MYPPPRPPVPPRRTGVPVGAVIGIACAAAMVFGLGGCVVGYAIGTTPDPNATAAATRTVERSPEPTTAEPRPTGEAETPAPAAPPTSATPTKPAKVTMPKVTGKNGASAQAELEALGFTDVTFGSADENASVVLLPQNWRVTKQDPAAGEKVQPGSPVVLTVVKLTS